MAKYSEDTKTAMMTALLLGEQTVEELACTSGISEGTLKKWKRLAQAADLSETPPVRSKKAVLEILEEGIQAYGRRMLEAEAIRTTSGYYAAMTVKNLNEQRQLLTGGPTQRIDLASFLMSAEPMHNDHEERINEPVMQALPN